MRMTTATQPQETTARIKRDELLRLLNVTSPVGYQAITARTRLDEVAAELARTSEPPAAPAVAPVVEAPAEIVSVPVADVAPPADFASGSKRKYPRPFSQVAALLPAVERPRHPRMTGPVLALRPPTSPPVRSLAVVDKQASHEVSDLRDRLDRGEDVSATSWISARVASHLTADEIAMLPADLQLRLPAAADWQTPPRIELTPMPGLPVIDLHPVPAQAPAEVTGRANAPAAVDARVVTIAFGCAAALLAVCAAYALL